MELILGHKYKFDHPIKLAQTGKLNNKKIEIE